MRNSLQTDDDEEDVVKAGCNWLSHPFIELRGGHTLRIIYLRCEPVTRSSCRPFQPLFPVLYREPKKRGLNRDKQRCLSPSVTAEGTHHPGRHQQLVSQRALAANRLMPPGKDALTPRLSPLNPPTSLVSVLSELFSDVATVVSHLNVV